MIPGVEIVEIKLFGECWGLAKHYDLSLKLREDKIKSIMETEADLTTSWCFGCMIQMKDELHQEKSVIKTKHPLELLGEAYGQ